MNPFPLSHGLHKRPHKADPKHLRFVHGLPCLICGLPGEAAHVRYASIQHGKPETGMGRKPDDRWCCPLCPAHHREGPDAQHGTSERQWWIDHKIDPLNIAALLFSASSVDDEDAARYICLGIRGV